MRFSSRSEVARYVSDQPIGWGKNGNPTLTEVVDMIVQHCNFMYNDDEFTQSIIDEVFGQMGAY